MKENVERARGAPVGSPSGIDVERLKVLVQSLPTEPNMPSNVSENVLRAIATLLKNGGIEATHE
jgi:hypothetical protein